jgi:hypothetical protein
MLRRMRWTGHVALMGEKRIACILLVGKSEGEIPLGRPRCRWVGTIQMDCGEMEWEGIDWIGLAKARDKWRALVKVVMNLRVP